MTPATPSNDQTGVVPGTVNIFDAYGPWDDAINAAVWASYPPELQPLFYGLRGNPNLVSISNAQRIAILTKWWGEGNGALPTWVIIPWEDPGWEMLSMPQGTTWVKGHTSLATVFMTGPVYGSDANPPADSCPVSTDVKFWQAKKWIAPASGATTNTTTPQVPDPIGANLFGPFYRCNPKYGCSVDKIVQPDGYALGGTYVINFNGVPTKFAKNVVEMMDIWWQDLGAA